MQREAGLSVLSLLDSFGSLNSKPVPLRAAQPQVWREKWEARDEESKTDHFSSQNELLLCEGCTVAITLVAPLPSDVFRWRGSPENVM